MNRVILCQINKQNAFVYQISTKLGRLVPSVKLLSHTYFGCVKLYGFGVISYYIFSAFWLPCTTFLTVTFLKINVRRNVAYHLVRHKILFHMTYLAKTDSQIFSIPPHFDLHY